MDIEQLDILEDKINQAVRTLEKVRIENQELMRTNQELRSTSEEKDRVIQQLRDENEGLKQLQTQNSIDKEKEELIKSKVEQMLSRLDDLEFKM
ncbi:cell division protein ZapB [bacterium]|nr:cell division protein ZapB [bacterium]